MKLYLDEHVPVTLATALVAHDVDCLTTQQAGHTGLPDEEQLAFAARNGRALVTFNRKDFLAIVRHWQEEGRSHAGLILSRELPVAELLRRFRRFLRRISLRTSPTRSSGWSLSFDGFVSQRERAVMPPRSSFVSLASPFSGFSVLQGPDPLSVQV